MWTLFHDMHSGGGIKLDWHYIYIEGDEKTARTIFKSMFDRDPDNVTCSCCGQDYSVSEYETLEDATEYYREKLTLEEYISLQKDCNEWESFHIIYEKDIDPELLAYAKLKEKFEPEDKYDYWK